VPLAYAVPRLRSKAGPFVRPETLMAWTDLYNDFWAFGDVWETFRAFFETRGLELFERCEGSGWRALLGRYPKNLQPRKLSPWVYAVAAYNEDSEPIIGGFEQKVRN
jgi:hypothetical protein